MKAVDADAAVPPAFTARISSLIANWVALLPVKLIPLAFIFVWTEVGIKEPEAGKAYCAIISAWADTLNARIGRMVVMIREVIVEQAWEALPASKIVILLEGYYRVFWRVPPRQATRGVIPADSGPSRRCPEQGLDIGLVAIVLRVIATWLRASSHAGPQIGQAK